MKFITFETDGTQSWGALTDNDLIVDLGSLMKCDLKTAINKGQLEDAQALALSTPPSLKLKYVKLLAPIPNPRMIACIGVNYAGGAY